MTNILWSTKVIIQIKVKVLINFIIFSSTNPKGETIQIFWTNICTLYPWVLNHDRQTQIDYLANSWSVAQSATSSEMSDIALLSGTRQWWHKVNLQKYTPKLFYDSYHSFNVPKILCQWLHYGNNKLENIKPSCQNSYLSRLKCLKMS